MLRAELAAIDAACSRFRPDSEISRLPGRARPRRWARCSRRRSPSRCGPPSRPTACVDPTVGHAVRALGYDRDFAEHRPRRRRPAPGAAGRARLVARRLGRRHASCSRRGVALDLGATAKALSADRIATRAAAATGAGVLVSLGGDVRGRRARARRRLAHRGRRRPRARPRRPRARRQHRRGRPRHLQHHPPRAGGARAAPCTTSSTRAPATSPTPVAHRLGRRRHLRRRQHRQHRRRRPRRRGPRLAGRAPTPRPSRRPSTAPSSRPRAGPRGEPRRWKRSSGSSAGPAGLVSLLLLTGTVVLGCAHATRAQHRRLAAVHAARAAPQPVAAGAGVPGRAHRVRDPRRLRRRCSGSTPSSRSSPTTTRSGWASARSRST